MASKMGCGSLERCAIGLLRWMGPSPRHIAFIMDGNRRYARACGMPVPEGHEKGYSSLVRVLEWCQELRVKVVTVFAFSIDNFNRPESEVDALMELAEEKFMTFLEQKSIVRKLGIRVQVLGNFDFIPERLKRGIATLIAETRENDVLTLNICFCYSSSEETCSTIRSIVTGVRDGALEKRDVDEDFIASCMYTRGESPDLVIRTSGETRLSDFLVWQINRAHLYFIKANWPEVGIWDFFSSILSFQMYYKEAKAAHNTERDVTSVNRQNDFRAKMQRDEALLMQKWLKTS